LLTVRLKWQEERLLDCVNEFEAIRCALDIKIPHMTGKSKAPETVSSASQETDVTMDPGYIADTELLEYAGTICE